METKVKNASRVPFRGSNEHDLLVVAENAIEQAL
jgi:hypothetical protein